MKKNLFLIFTLPDKFEYNLKNLSVENFGEPNKDKGNITNNIIVIDNSLNVAIDSSDIPQNTSEEYYKNAQVIILVDAENDHYKDFLTPFIGFKEQVFVVFHLSGADLKNDLRNIDKEKYKGEYYCSHDYDSSSVYYTELKKIAEAKHENKIKDFKQALQKLLERFQTRNNIIGIIKKCTILLKKIEEEPKIIVKDELEDIENDCNINAYPEIFKHWKIFKNDLNNNNISEKIEKLEEDYLKINSN